MMGLKPMEMIFIALIVLFIFGAKKLPEMGKGLGEGIKNFKKGLKDDDTPKQLPKKEDDGEEKSSS